MSLKNLSNENLIEVTEEEVRRERASTFRIIKLFQEIYDRKIYLDRGFPNFYEMVTEYFGYSAGSAMRRIGAMKLVREMPQFEVKLESGELSLTVAADVQSFLQQEAKIQRPYSMNAKIELVQACLHKSREEAEEEFVRRNPERERRESVRAVSRDRVRVSFSISKKLHNKLNHLKDLLSHVDPTMTTEALLERLTELGLDKHDPVRKAKRAKARKEKQQQDFEDKTQSSAETANKSGGIATSAAEVKRTRYIAADEKHAVAYDGKGCSCQAGGRRCGSTRFLQLDHVRPFADGGENVSSNLRWMCGSHNRWRAKRSQPNHIH